MSNNSLLLVLLATIYYFIKVSIKMVLLLGAILMDTIRYLNGPRK